jgi:phosphatidylserine/phosphatidylglycerophosphate/cardiolipin synthase-like enzyme
MKVNSNITFFIGLFLSGIIMLFYISPSLYVNESYIVINDDEYFDYVFELIDGAETSIHIVLFEIKYYDKYPDSKINLLVEKLIDKNKNGVDVKIIVDQFLTDPRAVEILNQTGVNIKYDSTTRTTHSKLIIIDEKIVIIGSTNWSHYSLTKNRESNIALNNKEIAKNFESYFEEVWINS